MGNRLTKIYTRTGDEGDTGLGDGSRLSKSSLRIEVIGDVDELNSFIGLLLSHEIIKPYLEDLHGIQHLLFNLGGELSTKSIDVMKESSVIYLEDLIDKYNEPLPPLKEFVLPGGNMPASICHVARAVCRRCERHLIKLKETEKINPLSCAFVNRLSDLLFVLARTLARKDNGEEVLWDKNAVK